MRSLIRRRAMADVPHDPAPTKWGYRYQRLMLTPGVRAAMRIGLPVLLVSIIAGAWFAKPENRAMLEAQIAQAVRGFQERPQFMVQSVTVTGADDVILPAITAILPKDYPQSSFDLDLLAIRARIESLDAVRSASVRVGPGGVLQVAVTPRDPVALWRDGPVLRLIDTEGVQSGTLVSRGNRPDLPLIAGNGAERHIQEALDLYARAGPLRDRVRGLVWMGERRWDIVLDRNQRILLPSDGPVAAFDRVIALDLAQDMLERDVTIVDMRNADRPTLRMNEDAAAALRRVTTPTGTGN
ncbi:cell division protein FtsQ/DivIB [Yoonia vestfoldensis]|uniref:Cell division protein FtsQ n=1 Tax=Yoonia vestfoldensis SKA53 TaxID=314232 RepID=A3V6L2_9RHOB|nr:cell division protein FtsQ/DivIB [Yoonia vestfoldensis]EAQ05878.1 cell division septal protein FtsQ [Yoonia vestfoldensis SKA53]